MSVLRIDGSSLEVVDKVKILIDEIGNIERFSVYQEDIPNKYVDIPSCYLYKGEQLERKTTYTLILENRDSDQEVWIEGATCGFSGTGPSCTVEILQILGVKMDFQRISTEKFIRDEEVTLVHDLNFVIYQTDDHHSKSRLMKVMMKFETANKKLKAKEMFNMLGYIRPLRNFSSEEPESYYFRIPYDTKQELAQYTTNNRLTLHERLINIDVNTLYNLVQQIAYEYDAEITTKIYEKTK